jgi:hypothetical protein
MSRSSNIGRADNFRAGRAYAHNAPFSGSLPGILLSHLYVLQYGGSRSKQDYSAPAAAAANNIGLAQAKLSAGALLLNGSLVVDGEAILDVPRNIQLDSSNAGDTTQSVTLVGLDAAGDPLTEVVALNGTTNVFGAKAFSKLTSASVSAALAGNITIGTGTRLGFPFAVWDANEVLFINEDGVASAPTINVSNAGNGLGTFTPETVPDGSIVYTALIQVIDNTESAYTVNPAI